MAWNNHKIHRVKRKTFIPEIFLNTSCLRSLICSSLFTNYPPSELLEMSLNKLRGNKLVITNLFFQVFHMLPTEMCFLCSLLPGDDKLAFSVFWEITPQAEILKHYITRSVIKSCAQLSYQHAQVNFDWFEAYLIIQKNFLIHTLTNLFSLYDLYYSYFTNVFPH